MDDVVDKLNKEISIDFEELPLKFVTSEVREIDLSIGLAMVGIPRGRFQQGSPSSENGRGADESSRTVVLTDDFWLGATPVTQLQWQEVMDSPGCKYPESQDGNKPANGISWFEACEFCEKLTAREKKRGRLESGYQFRLPTEAEWEYACRAGELAPCYGEVNEIAALKTLQKVAKYKPNNWGLWDLFGNVHEWCLDSYSRDYTGGLHLEYNPCHLGQQNDAKVFRGGSFQEKASNLRAAARWHYEPNQKSGQIGFRVALVKAKVS